MDIWTGFVIGFLGSFHCVGMCGPIVIALPTGNNSQLQIMISRILYNLGRVVTYTFFGLVFGLLGERLSFIGLQQTASITLGASIVVFVLIPKSVKAKAAQTSLYKFFADSVKSAFYRLTKSGSSQSMFLFGIINGFLPCGFVYVAIAGAVTTGGILSGAAYMALFGLGTTPIMLATAMLGKFINVEIKRRINKLIPALALVLGIIFILRGLNLGIPYLSPKLITETPQKEIICH